MHARLPNQPIARSLVLSEGILVVFLLLLRLFSKRRFLVVISISPLPLIRVGDPRSVFVSGTVEEEGLVGPKSYHSLAWVTFLRPPE